MVRQTLKVVYMVGKAKDENNTIELIIISQLLRPSYMSMGIICIIPVSNASLSSIEITLGQASSNTSFPN